MRWAQTICSLTVATCLAGCKAAGPNPLPDLSGRQVYWDQTTQPDLPPPGPGGDCRGVLDAVAARYGHPPLMAIGDSLYNGVQSLRINWWLSEWSAPSLVALRLGLIDEHAADRLGTRRFFGPQYPRYASTAAQTRAAGDYGFNLETADFDDLLLLPQNEASRLEALSASAVPPNHRPVVDNIAFLSAQTGDLLDWTAADHANRVAQLLPHLRGALPGTGFTPLGNTMFHANASFVLNPMHNACIARMTPLDQVRLRVPRRLLVNIGANDGLWQIAFFADPITMQTCADSAANLTIGGKTECVPTTIAQAAGPGFLHDMARMLDQLAAIAGIERVYVNGLPLPSQTANLIRDADGAHWDAALFSGPNARIGMTDAQMQQADALIAQTNAQLARMVEAYDQAAVAGYPRFAFVDLAAKLGTLDYKGCVARGQSGCAQKQLVVDAAHFGLPRDQALDNRPLHFSGPSGPQTGPDMRPSIDAGGLMSFDNMHLSSVGYEVMAQAVIEQMARLEPDFPATTVAQCQSSGQAGFVPLRDNDCIAFMTRPGWAYADATRRNFVFDRTGGSQQEKNQQTFSAIAGLAVGLTRNGQ